MNDLHHAPMQREIQKPNQTIRSLRAAQLSRGPQRQNSWKGMPVVFVHGPHKGVEGYIRSVTESYPPANFGSNFGNREHECITGCNGCKAKALSAEHTCPLHCRGCKQAREDISRHTQSLNDFIDIRLQIEKSGGDTVQVSVRDVRPSK